MNIYKTKRYDGVFSPAVTFTTQTNKVTGVKISCNGSSYSSTDMQVSATVGDTVSMSYSVYGVGTYNTTATWNTGSTESTITVKPTAAGTYTYKATSVGDTSIISPTITLTVTESVVTSVTAVTLTRNGATVSADEQVEVNIGESVTFNYAVIGTGSYNTTAKWSTDNTTSSEKYITFSTAGTYVVYATSVGDSTKVSPKCTIVVKENTGTVSGVTLYKNGVALTENTTVSVIKGSSMTLSYTVSGTGNYNTNAMWQDDSSTTTPRTITFNKVETYSYRVESVQDNTIYSYTLTVDIKNPVDEVQILKDGTKLTSNTQYTATVGDTISLSYVVAGLSETTTATWSDNGSTTTPRSITYTTAGTYTYKATAVADTSVSSYIVTVVVSAATPTVTGVDISYNGTTLKTNTTYNANVGDTVSLGYTVNGTGAISKIAKWRDKNTITTDTSNPRSITFTTAGTYTYDVVVTDAFVSSYAVTVIVSASPTSSVSDVAISAEGGSLAGTDATADTTYTVYVGDDISVSYQVKGTNLTSSEAYWNNDTTNVSMPLAVPTTTTGTHTYQATSVQDNTKHSYTVTIVVVEKTTITAINMQYKKATDPTWTNAGAKVLLAADTRYSFQGVVTGTGSFDSTSSFTLDGTSLEDSPISINNDIRDGSQHTLVVTATGDTTKTDSCALVYLAA